jgi:hypothetical protein
MMSVEDLLNTYEKVREKGSSRELAELEAEIVAQIHKQGEKIGDRRVFFKKRFGGRGSDYDARSMIYRAGPWALPMFDRLDRGVKTNTVLLQLRAIKEEAEAKNIDPEKVLERVVSEGSIPAPRARPFVPANTGQGASKQFRLGVEALAERFMDTMFRNVSVEIKNQLLSDFKTTLDQLLDEFRARAVRTKREARIDGLKRIGIERFKWACEVFGVQAKFGQSINIKKISRLRIRRLRDLHPDRNAGERARHEFDAVNTAFEILQTYSSQVIQTRKGKEDGLQEEQE